MTYLFKNKLLFSVFILLAFFFSSCAPEITLITISDQCPFKGSMTIYDHKKAHWFFSDQSDAYRETLPASTFKIINSLIALEVKAVENENEVLKWDGQEKYAFGKRVESWEDDSDLKSAFENSTVWFYVELAKKIGREQYRNYLLRSHYGNHNLTEAGDDFWNKGLFAVSPVNQIRFLNALYENKLPFSQKTMDTVKNISTVEKTSEYTLHAKTGWAQERDTDIGWWIGYVEKVDNVYFFATRFIKDSNEKNDLFDSCRISATREALRKLGVL